MKRESEREKEKQRDREEKDEQLDACERARERGIGYANALTRPCAMSGSTLRTHCPYSKREALNAAIHERRPTYDPARVHRPLSAPPHAIPERSLRCVSQRRKLSLIIVVDRDRSLLTKLRSTAIDQTDQLSCLGRSNF